MFGLSQLLKSAGALALSLKGQWLREPKRQIRRAPLQLETLEDRMVPTLLGQNLFPAEYAWNQNIANAPVAANSAAIMTNIGSTISVHPDWGNSNPANGAVNLWGIPVNIVHGNTAPKVNFIIDSYPGESDIIPVPMPANPILEGDYQNGPNMNGPGYGTNQRGDSHLLIWDQDNNIAYELYGVARPNDPVTMSGTSTGGVWHAAQQTVWNMNTNDFRTLGDTSSDAAGLSVIAGLARPDEGLPVSQGGQGAINHAIRFTLPSGRINPQYVYPASHMVYTTQGSANVPLGARFRLKNDAATNTKINALGPQAQIIARAMQQYGLILADIGAPMYITGASAHYDPNTGTKLVWNMDDVLGLQNIKSGDFEVVDLTPRVTGLSSTTAAPGSTISVYGKNFSGAAGRLSVYFGTVAVTSVTYVSDTQVNVVVPNSTGTVHVQVQSGINAVDPNGQSHNVTAPIHGYGKSAATSADWFTFTTGTTISGANSTASFATPTVVSGAGDVLTIAVKNTLGNAVGGLANSAFSFTWSGGTSTGTFSPVTQTATQGTYTTTFTGVLAGSNTLTITVGGVTFAVHPTITVNAGAVNGGTSTASFATPTVAVGGADVLTIRVKDAAGNPITGLTTSAFNFALSGGTSTGGFSTVSATATAGTYVTTFTGNVPGTMSTLTVTVAGVTFAVHPTITVTAGGVSAATSTASFATPIVASGGADPLTIAVKDAAGNPIAGLASSAFSFSLSGGTSTGSFSTVSATATAGTYTTNFTGLLAGTTSSLTITVAGVTLAVQPTITVTGAAVSATTSTASFATSTVAVGGANLITIRVKDAAGNPITGLSSSAFGFLLTGGSSTGTFTSASETGTPGTYTATFVGATFGTTSTLTITVSGITLAAHPTVAVTGATTFVDDFSSAGANQQLNSSWTKWVGGYLVDTSNETARGTATLNLATVQQVSTIDAAVSATVTLINGQTAGLVARHTGPGDRNMYAALIAAKNSSYVASVHRNVNGTWTKLYSKTYSGTVTNAVMEFDVVGSSLRLFLNGKVVAFGNDTRITGPGSVGMRTGFGATMSNFGAAPLTLANQSMPFFQSFSVAGPNNQLNNAWFNRAGNTGVNNGNAVGNSTVNLATVNGIQAANFTVQADIVLSGIGQNGGLVGRYDGNGDRNMYLVRVAQTKAYSFDVALMVNVAGVWRTLRTQAVSSGSGTLRLVTSGNSLTVSYRGSTLFTVVDSSISAAGYVGLRLKAGATADNFDVY